MSDQTPLRVLIIDDDADMRRLAAVLLTRNQMIVAEAPSGDAGIALATRERPDVILLDSVMPGKDGPATFADLQREPQTAAIPVIFLTGTSNPAELERLGKLGARGVLNKPFGPSTLAERVRAILATG